MHWSDCATHNGPALPQGPCDCGGVDMNAWQEFYNRHGRPPTPAELPQALNRIR